MIRTSGVVVPTRLVEQGARYLRVEAHLKAIGLWFWLAGASAVVAGIASVLLVLPGSSIPLALACCAIGAGWIALGHSLRRFSNRARAVARTFSGLGIAGCALSLWKIGAAPSVTLAAVSWGLCAVGSCALFRVLGVEEAKEICGNTYRSIALGRPGRSPASSIFFWAPLAGALLVLALGALTAGPSAGAGTSWADQDGKKAE